MWVPLFPWNHASTPPCKRLNFTHIVFFVCVCTQFTLPAISGSRPSSGWLGFISLPRVLRGFEHGSVLPKPVPITTGPTLGNFIHIVVLQQSSRPFIFTWYFLLYKMKISTYYISLFKAYLAKLVVLVVVNSCSSCSYLGSY